MNSHENRIRLLSLFSGIGAFEKALQRLGIDYDLVNYCEIDKHAAKSYSLIHNEPESKNLVDVTTIDTSKLEDIDMITYGFPCQDISISGHQKGFFDEDGKVTRSGLFFEALRIIEDTKPKWAIAENVKNLMSDSFYKELDIVLSSLGKAGYNNYIKVLNAKDYGIPQHRERVFIVSIRQDVDDYSFSFPQEEELNLRLKDILEEKVDEKFYLNETMKDCFINHSFRMESKGNGFRFSPHVQENADIAKAILTRAGERPDDNYIIDIDSQLKNFSFDTKNPEVIQIANVLPTKTRENPNQGRVYDKRGISPTLTTMKGGNKQPMIVDSASLDPIIIDDIYKSREPREYSEYAPTLRSPKCGELKVIYSDSQTIKANESVFDFTDEDIEVTYPEEPFIEASRGCDPSNPSKIESPQVRIRKLTPKECFRLMGFDDKDVDILVENGISNSQLYKMAGNSIVVNVLERIFENLILKKEVEADLLSLMFG